MTTSRTSTAATVVPLPPTAVGKAGRVAIAAMSFLALAAFGGSSFLLAAPDGHLMQWDTGMLAGSPFSDFLIPALILAGLFGVGSVVVVVLGLRRAPIAPFLAFAIGCGQMIWIVVELAIIHELSFLHPLMFATGLVIAIASARWGWPTFAAWRAAR